MCRTEDGEEVSKQGIDESDEDWYLTKDGYYSTEPEKKSLIESETEISKRIYNNV